MIRNKFVSIIYIYNFCSFLLNKLYVKYKISIRNKYMFEQ